MKEHRRLQGTTDNKDGVIFSLAFLSRCKECFDLTLMQENCCLWSRSREEAHRWQLHILLLVSNTFTSPHLNIHDQSWKELHIKSIKAMNLKL